MARKIFRSGNSLAVSLPKDALGALHLGQGDEVEVKLDRERGAITIAPVAPAPLPVDEGLARQVSTFIEQYRPALEALARATEGEDQS